MFDMQRGTAWVDQRENVRGRTHTSSSSFEVNLKTLICFIFVTGALFIHAAAGAQPTAPAPRAVLGVMLRELSAEEIQSGGHGAFVQTVVPNGPAEKAGVRAGDIIIGANRQAITSGAQLVQMIGRRGPGDLVELVVLRSGRRQRSKSRLRRPLRRRLRPRQHRAGLGRQRRNRRLNPLPR